MNFFNLLKHIRQTLNGSPRSQRRPASRRLTLERLEDRTLPSSFGYAFPLGGSAIVGRDEGYAVATDAAGNTYVTGVFAGTADFDPGPGVTNLTAKGLQDVFVAKYSPIGSLVWARSIGGTDEVRSAGIAVDEAGAVVVAGGFHGKVDFDPSAGTANLTSLGGSDAYVLKLTAAGNLDFVRRMGGASSEEAQAVALGPSGAIHVSGNFGGTGDFNPNVGVNNLTSAGGDDVFVVKLSAGGNFAWARRLGGVGHDEGNGIGVDAAGNIHVAGSFNGVADFNPGAGVFNMTSAGLSDVFVSKLSSAGNFVWAKQMGGASHDLAEAMALDAGGNVHVAGRFHGVADHDPGAGVFNLTSVGGGDSFVTKLNSAGGFVWARSMGSPGSSSGNDDNASGVAVDASGNVYVTGSFAGTADFDPGAGVANLKSTAAGDDVFVWKLDNIGKFAWARNMGGVRNDWGNAIAVSSSGHIYTTGMFQGTADFDPGAAVYNITSAGASDAFVSQLTEPGALVYAAPAGNGADSMVLRRNGRYLEVTSSTGTVLARRAVDATTIVRITGTDREADTFRIDFDFGGSFAPAGGIQFNAGTGADTLIGPNSDMAWRITRPDEGTFLVNGAFSGVDILVGGSMSDVFMFDPIGTLRQIDGGAGSDMLDYSGHSTSSGVIVNLMTGQAEATSSVTRIENVHGSGGNDMLTGDNGPNILLGGDGADVIFAEDGRDLIIGGDGEDTLMGGGDEDIVIGGPTRHDVDHEALAAIMTEWLRTDLSYGERTKSLRYGGGKNGAFVFDSSTVIDDMVFDKLRGEAGDDWFWALGSDDHDAVQPPEEVN